MIKPMLATLIKAPFDDPNFIFEIKWDGYRAVAEVKHGKVKLYSRYGQDFMKKFPAIAEELGKIKHNVVLDGEVVVLDESGRSKFELLQNYIRTREGNMVYYV